MTEFHPIQNDITTQPFMPTSVTLRAYEVYCEVYGEQPKMIEGSCRGGFGARELIAFLYARSFPKEQWRQRVEEALERKNI